MESNISTIAFRSNLYPVQSNCLEDHTFQSKIHDPFALTELQKHSYLTLIQKDEFRWASGHCSYAGPDDYPWGTITDPNGKDRVVCKCLNQKCHRFSICRPDFDPAELGVLQENQKAQPAIFSIEKAAQKRKTADDGDSEAASKLFSGSAPNSEPKGHQEPPVPAGKQPSDDPFEIKKPVQPVPTPPKTKGIDFGSFVETVQEAIIEAPAIERTIVNAGPGTGKTWTLIEKIIHMINAEQAAAENILVLCFSRSAVEVVRTRLADAAEAGRIGFEWQDVDVRTFDSFSTYMLAWVLENHPELLHKGFLLEAHNYDDRIKVAKSVFEKKKDILADYEHIIVDEVQDLVGPRAELVLAMLRGLPESCGFTILGDSCQSLYDYMAEGNPSIMSSEKFYQNIFKSFPNANYYALIHNHRQGDELGEMMIPYRQAILTGSARDRASVAEKLLSTISALPVKLTQFSRSDALRYVGQGKTLGILTRTNGQALQISAWLQNADVPHSLHRGLGAPTLGDWIAQVFCDYENESVDQNTFIAKHLSLFPEVDYETAQARWMALVATQPGEARNRYEVSDLLKGLLRNAREPVLFESGTEKKHAITVSNIHRAKGKEFDHVIVIDDVIEAMANPENEDILEHKVCYVALTRPKIQIERAEISKKDKQIYITRNEDQSQRCSKAGGFGKKRYISHFEVGSDVDLDVRTLASGHDLQRYIRKKVYSGMRLKLIKCPEGTKPYIVYRVVVEDNENMVLGYTSKAFACELEKAIQHIKNLNCSIFYELFPHAFCDVYVHNVTTCVSGLPPVPPGAKTFGDVSIWSGLTIKGFAAFDKDTY